MPSGLAVGPGRWAGPRVDLVEHPLGLHDPRLRLVLAVEAIDRPKAALSRLQADAEGAVGLLDQLEVWDCHGSQYGTGAPGLHPQSVGISFRTVQSAPGSWERRPHRAGLNENTPRTLQGRMAVGEPWRPSPTTLIGACRDRSIRVTAFGKAAARGLPRSMPGEPPTRQAAKQWIADPVPQTRP